MQVGVKAPVGFNSSAPIRPVVKVHFLGWSVIEDMYVLQSEVFEVTKEAFEAKLRIYKTYHQPMAPGEIQSLLITYEQYKFGNSKISLLQLLDET